MEIIYKSPSELKPFQKNPYNHSEKQLTMLKKSMREFGFTSPILISQDNMVIAGHARLKAAQEIGLSEVPTIFIDLPYEKAVAYVIADNQLAKLAEEDRDLLGELLEGALSIPDFDIEAVGFSSEDIDSLLQSGEPVEVVEDEFNPGEEVETRCKEGDLWQLGRHRLLCGSSTNPDDVNRLMDGETFELLATSPPYNQGNSSGDLLTNGGKEVRLYNDKNADNKTAEEYYQFLISVLKIAYEFRNTDSHTIAWNVAYNAKSRDDYGKIIFSNENPFKVKESIVWDKHHSINLPQVGIYSRRCEFVFILSSNPEYRTTQVYNDCRWNYWQFNSSGSQMTGDNIEHRAAFPVEFISKIIQDFSFDNDNIYEPFCGSGTTLIACEQLNRNCFAMELDPHYCDVILSRWEQFTNQTAKKLN